MKILVINPGSTSTKIAVYHDEKCVFKKGLNHSVEELAPYKAVVDQHEFRKELILKELADAGIPIEFDAVVARGGLLKPIPGGTYRVNDQMIHDVHTSEHHHASDLGCIIAREIAKNIPGCDAFIADPVVVDELDDHARVCGSPLMQRVSIWHPLNQRAIARRYAKEHATSYDKLNLIVCHLGGGVSVAAHKQGRAVDVNNALDGEGPLAPERAGTLPASSLVRLCYSGKYTLEETLKMLCGNAGLAALIGINDMREVERAINEDHNEKYKFYVDAMIYSIAKSICALGAAFCGKVDAIILTGGMAYWPYLRDEITRRVEWVAPVQVYPGEDELEALAGNALAVLRGDQQPKEYK